MSAIIFDGFALSMMPVSKTIKPKRRLPSFVRWTIWVLLAQIVLINISAALHAYKLTHFYNIKDIPPITKGNDNLLSKTWRLFAGTRFARNLNSERPGFGYDTVQLKTKAGIILKAWYSEVDSAEKGTVILFHGLSNNKSTILDRAYEFRFLGYNVLMIDARAHGESEGSTTTIGFRESEDVKLAFDYAVGKGVKRIFLWGFSMGAVEIMKAVADYSIKPAGIILESPFFSLQSHIKWRARTIGFPQQPYGSLVSWWIGVENGFNAFGFKMTSYAAKIECPVLLQYGQKDQLVTNDEIAKIFTAFGSKKKKLIEYAETGHESLLTKDSNLWRNEVEKFLVEETVN